MDNLRSIQSQQEKNDLRKKQKKVQKRAGCCCPGSVSIYTVEKGGQFKWREQHEQRAGGRKMDVVIRGGEHSDHKGGGWCKSGK